MKGQYVEIDNRRDRLHLFKAFDARLGLAGFGGLCLEPIDEGFEMFALIGLLLLHLLQNGLLLGALLLKIVVAAFVERQLGLIEVENLIDRLVQQIAIMADDQHGMGISFEIIHQPKRAFEIEIVGRLVEQQ